VIGLLAQEVQKVAPEVVKVMDDGYLSVNYVELIPVIISAFNQHIEQAIKDKDHIEKNLEDLKKNIDILTNKDFDDRELLDAKLLEIQQIVASLKQERSKSVRKTLKNSRCIIPIVILIFFVVVLCSAVGILFYKTFVPASSNQNNQYSSSPHEIIEPVYSVENDGINLVFNPSFEEVDPKTNLAYNWDTNESYELLTETGESKGNTLVLPFYGTKSLSLTTTNSEESIVVTQVLLIAETPRAINFSGWGNGDLYSPNTTNIPFMVALTLEYADFQKKRKYCPL